MTSCLKRDRKKANAMKFLNKLNSEAEGFMNKQQSFGVFDKSGGRTCVCQLRMRSDCSAPSLRSSSELRGFVAALQNTSDA